MAFTQISTDGIKNGTITGSDLATNIELTGQADLHSDSGSALTEPLMIRNGGSGAGTNVGMIFFNGDGTSTGAGALAKIKAIDVGSFDADLVFETALKSGFSTGGTAERLRITSTGDLRIPFVDNSTGLRQKIQFVTEANFFDEVGYIAMDRTAVSSAPSDMVFATGTAGSVTQKMRIDSSGNVGIGTTSPSRRLNLNIGSDQTWFQIDKSRAANEAMLQLVHTAGNRAAAIRYANSQGSWKTGIDGTEAFVIASGATDTGDGTPRLTIDSSGNVGMGVSTPLDRLAINYTVSSSVPAGGIRLQDDTNTTVTVLQTTVSSYNYAGVSGHYSQLYGSRNLAIVADGANSGSIQCMTGNAIRTTITSAGDILLRTVSTTINQSNAGSGFLSDGVFKHFRAVGGGQHVLNFGGNDGLMQVRGDGDVVNTNNEYGAISDENLKQDIIDAASQWNDIKDLRVRKFRLKDNPTGVLQIGVVAQEVEKVSPGLVKTDDEGVKSVKYSVLYMKAVKCLQEAMAKIEILETEVAALKAS